jgi:hypothetical protein
MPEQAPEHDAQLAAKTEYHASLGRAALPRAKRAGVKQTTITQSTEPHYPDKERFIGKPTSTSI